jgi:hypothetical protein
MRIIGEQKCEAEESIIEWRWYERESDALRERDGDRERDREII